MGMGFAPTWLRQVTPPTPLHKNTLTTGYAMVCLSVCLSVCLFVSQEVIDETELLCREIADWEKEQQKISRRQRGPLCGSLTRFCRALCRRDSEIQ